MVGEPQLAKDVDELVINIDVRKPIASDKRRGSMGFSHGSLNWLGVTELIMKGGFIL